MIEAEWELFLLGKLTSSNQTLSLILDLAWNESLDDEDEESSRASTFRDFYFSVGFDHEESIFQGDRLVFFSSFCLSLAYFSASALVGRPRFLFKGGGLWDFDEDSEDDSSELGSSGWIFILSYPSSIKFSASL